MTPAELRRWRAKLDLTQAEAAERLGLSWRQYARLEAEGSKISRTIELLAGAVAREAKAAA